MTGKQAFWDAVAGRSPAPPAAALLGWCCEAVDGERGRARIRYTATDQLLNPFGRIQGGMLVAMLDDAMGPALFAALDEGLATTTVEIKTNFIAPAAPGPILAEGWVVHKGRSLAFLEGRLTDKEDGLIATGQATARIFPVNRGTSGRI